MAQYLLQEKYCLIIYNNNKEKDSIYTGCANLSYCFTVVKYLYIIIKKIFYLYTSKGKIYGREFFIKG